ncbi:MAG TPA: hypothetical protein VLX92_22295 [Kofleriaceae bacterium]|nr:hypothetical protein [Kofleriaceae bacterium]
MNKCAIACCLAACGTSSPVPAPQIVVDGLPSAATITAYGTRDHVAISIDPASAVIAGEALGLLDFQLDLTGAPDCAGCGELAMALEGQAATASFDYGGLPYQVEAAPRAGDVVLGPCPFDEQGDSLHVPRGIASGTFGFTRLDPAGARLSVYFTPTFGPGLPEPGVEHTIELDEVDVTF